MKRLLKSIILSICCLQVAAAEISWSFLIDRDISQKVATLTENHATNILRIFESMPWIEEGSQQGEGKYLYIFYAPNSEESRALYTQTRDLLDQVNIRWIPIQRGDLSVDGLYETRTPEALKNAMINGIIPEVQDVDRIKRIASMTFTGFIYLRASNIFSPETQSYFPTVIYGDKDNLTIEIEPNDIEALIQNIPLSIPNTQIKTIEALAAEPVTLFPVKKFAYYTNEDPMPTEVYLYPSKNSPYLGALDNTLPISGITDNGYMAIDLIDGTGRYIYLKYFEDNIKIQHDNAEE